MSGEKKILEASQYRLDVVEAAHPAWIKAVRCMEARMSKHIADLCKDHGPEKTAKIRGAIQELNALLGLLSPDRKPPAQDPSETVDY